MLVTSIFFFSHNVFYPRKRNFNVLSTFDLPSANAFNLGKPNILLSGKGLRIMKLMILKSAKILALLNWILTTMNKWSARLLYRLINCTGDNLGFNVTLIAKVISWQSVTHVFPGFLTPVLIHFFFPKPLTVFLTYFCRGERRKYARKKVCLNRGSNSQSPGHESDK